MPGTTPILFENWVVVVVVCVCPHDLGSRREGMPNSTVRDNYNEDALVRDNHKNDGSRKT